MDLYGGEINEQTQLGDTGDTTLTYPLGVAVCSVKSLGRYPPIFHGQKTLFEAALQVFHAVGGRHLQRTITR